MGRSQRHKVYNQGVASNDELVAQGEINPIVEDAIITAAEEGKPVLSSLNPNTAAISDPDFTISCMGDNFDENCTIVWMGAEEPTTFVSETELTTGVVPSVVTSPTTIEVFIRKVVQGHPVESQIVVFTWTEAVAPPQTETDNPTRRG